MKKLCLLATVAAVAVLAMSCGSLFGGDDEDADASLEGQVYSVTKVQSTGGVQTTMSMPISLSLDMDMDGTSETMTTSSYMYLSGGTAYSFAVVDVEDGGSTTGTLTDYEGTEGNSVAYSISGNSITMDGETGTYSISGNTLTFTISDQIDEDDEDEDGNTTETYSEIITLTAVSSPTFAQLSADAGL